MSENPPRILTLAERLDWLFQTVRRPDGSNFSYQDVEDGTDALGYRLTTTAVWKIRSGQTTNPGYLALRVLSRFFAVPDGFFYAEELTPDDMERMRIAAILKEQGAGEIAFRAVEIGTAGQEALLTMLRFLAETQAKQGKPHNADDAEQKQ